MDKRQSRITILICLVIAIGIVFFGLRSRSRTSGNVSIPPPVPNVQASQMTAVSSPDGKMSLTAKQKKGEGTTTYTFLITNESTGDQKEIFTKIVPSGTVLSVPDNTFSSDNKYVFLKEKGLSMDSYFVLTTSGAPVYKDAQIFDFSSLFNEKYYKDYIITDATGWAGPTLVVINTNKSGGGVGPSFWFDIASKSFILLSNRFD